MEVRFASNDNFVHVILFFWIFCMWDVHLLLGINEISRMNYKVCRNLCDFKLGWRADCKFCGFLSSLFSYWQDRLARAWPIVNPRTNTILVRVVLIVGHKRMHLIILFISSVTRLFVHASLHVSTFPQKCLLPTATYKMFDIST